MTTWRQSAGSRLQIFSLRNFNLHLDQAQEIGLDTEVPAYALADALAMLHWHTKIDAMDMEFVLGSSPQEDQRVGRNIPLETLLASNTPTSTFEYVTNSNADNHEFMALRCRCLGRHHHGPGRG